MPLPKKQDRFGNSLTSNESFIIESDMLTKEADDDTNIIIVTEL